MFKWIKDSINDNTLKIGPFVITVEKHKGGYTFVEYGCLSRKYNKEFKPEYFTTE